MRVYALYLVTLLLIAGTLRQWFLGVYGLLLMNLLLEHPDYPNEMLGISGLNPWNVLYLITIAAWLTQRRYEPAAPPMSTFAKFSIGAYLATLTFCVGMASVKLDAPAWTGLSQSALILDYYLNPLKILFLGYLVYVGANTPQRQIAVASCVLLSAMLTSVLVLKYRITSGLSADFMRGRQRLGKEVGLHANQIGWVLAGTFWGIVAMAGVWRRRLMRWLSILSAAIPGLAVLVVQSRAGYLAMAAGGLVFGAVRWRKMLLILPAAAAVIMTAFPSVAGRILMGVEESESPLGTRTYDMDVITAGRLEAIWPPVVEAFRQAPVLGHGRLAILRTSAREKIIAAMGWCPSHPHNAILELLADSGVVGTFLVTIFYLGFFVMSARLLRLRASPVAQAVGGVALALLSARLVTGVSGCSFFPIRSMFGLFAAGGLALRLAAQYARATTTAEWRTHPWPATTTYSNNVVPFPGGSTSTVN